MSTNGGRGVVILRCVSVHNNNKYYIMKDNGDGTFTAKYGRVGGHESVAVYPISKWNSKYREKTRKKASGKAHYKDVTELVAQEVASNSGGPNINTDDPDVRELMRRLQRFAKGAVSRTYDVGVGNVTQAMIDEAQGLIDSLSDLADKDSIPVRKANDLLIDLYTVIPRKMKDVNDHLLFASGANLPRIVYREQDNIDTLSQQVVAHHRGDDEEGGKGILESMGIRVFKASDEDMEEIRKIAAHDEKYVRRAYRIENIKTQEKFLEFLKDIRKNEDRDKRKTLWHGSRNPNWLSIIEKGLRIRPPGVRTTGAAFGRGIYFAEELGKSRGYTSIKGAYWTQGSENIGFCALYDVFVGRELVLDWGDGSLSLGELQRRGKYDSVYAKKGRLNRSERIVYRQEQNTIKYLVQIV